MGFAKIKGTGWMKDYPDFRDNTPNTKTISQKQEARGVTEPVGQILKRVDEAPVKKAGAKKTSGAAKTAAKKVAVATKIDLSQWCSPVEDQGEIGSCTAHAGVGLYEYYERKAFGKHIDASRLFLYKVTRNLLKWKGDDGAYLRTTMAAMALFGVPPERYWPYNETTYNEEPSAFMYSYAKNFKALLYYRLDGNGVRGKDLLEIIKDNLRKALPMIFGFTCFSSLDQADKDGKIPFPDKNEEVDGGHAVMAVGFDDNIEIINPNNKIAEKGAIKIRNSWGPGWGDKGYGWLPYKYVLEGIADDFWSMTKAEWIDTHQFGLGKG